MCLISNQQMGIKFSIVGLSRNIPTVVGITGRGNSCEKKMNFQLIVINICVDNKL